MSPDRIKVGLLIDGFFVPAWIHETIKRIRESDCAMISLVVKKQMELPVKRQQKKPGDNFNFLAYNLYRKLENKYVKLNPNAFSQKNISDLIINVPVLNILPVEEGNFDRIQENDLHLIDAYQLDVCIKFGFQNLKGYILTMPKFGVWEFEENLVNHKVSLAGVREVMQGYCETAVSLRLLSEKCEEGYILYESFSSTNTLINKNQNTACWKAVSFIPRKLKELYETKGDCFFEKVKEKQSLVSENKHTSYAPNNSRFISYLINRYFKWGKKKAGNLFNTDQWILLYFNKKDGLPLSIANYNELIPSKDKFW